VGRAVKLKLLRQIARDASVGAPYREYGEVQHYKDTLDEKGHPQKVPIGKQIILHPKCTRRIYKALKRLNPPGTMRIFANASS
jgi:hypothetical protein